MLILSAGEIEKDRDTIDVDGRDKRLDVSLGDPGKAASDRPQLTAFCVLFVKSTFRVSSKCFCSF